MYIIDYGLSELLDPKYRSQYIDDFFLNSLPNIKYKDRENTLPINLYKTIKTFLHLCLEYDDKIKEIQNIIIQNNNILEYYNYRYNKMQSCIFSSNDFDYFMIRALNDSIKMLNEFYNVLFNQNFINYIN